MHIANSLEIAVILALGAMSCATGSESFPRLIKSESQISPVKLSDPMPRFVTSRNFGNDSSRSKILTMVLPVNFGGRIFPFGPLSTKSFELALDLLNEQPNFLPGYELVFELIDDQCNDGLAISKLLRRVRMAEGATPDDFDNYIPVPIVPSVGCSTYGRVIPAEALQYFNFVNLGVISYLPELHFNRDRYPTYFEVGQQADISHVALTDFFEKIGWRRIAIIGEMLPFFDEMEKSFLPNLEARNITVSWYGKVMYKSSDHEEMEKVFQELKKGDPRVIVVDADSGMSMACWLHRMDLYGPGRMTFFLNWAGLSPNENSIPNYVRDWCTPEMIVDVMVSSFLFGESTLIDTFGRDNVYDSTGHTGTEYFEQLNSRIVDLDKSFIQFFAPFNYDIALYAGILANYTEATLKLKNETIDNLNGSINDIIETIYTMPIVHGYKGEYKVEKTTRVNSKGYVPVTFTQIQISDSGSLSFELVAYYKSSDQKEPMHFIDGKLKWRTSNGLPPKDSGVYKSIEVKPISTGLISALMAIGILLIGLNCVFVVTVALSSKWVDKLRKPPAERQQIVLPDVKLRMADGFILFGNLCLIGTCFALPLDVSDRICLNTIIISGLLIVGYSSAMLGNLFKLYSISKSLLPSIGIAIAWLAVNSVLLALFLWFGKVSPERFNMAQYSESVEAAVIFQPYYFSCQLTHFGIVAICTLAVMGGLQFIFAMLTAWFSYLARSKKFGRDPDDESIATATGIYCQLLIIVAICLIAATITDKFLIIVIAVGGLLIALLNLATMSAAKVKLVYYKPPPPAATRTGRARGMGTTKKTVHSISSKSRLA